MSSGDPTDLAAQAAAAAAQRATVIELFTLYALGVVVTMLRTYSRVKMVGWANFKADDYLVWCAILVYSLQTGLAYSIGNSAHGLANNAMSDAERAALSFSDPEFELRVIGSKIQVVGWCSYSTLISFLKTAMLIFYTRLTEGLGRRYRMRIYVGLGLVVGTYIASLATILLSCLPFYKYWQINPDPGNVCQAAVSLPIIWVTFASNIVTDIYLILIPIPLLWGSTLKTVKKVASTIVLGAGIFVLVCATLKSIFVLVDPVNGAQLAGSWGTREAFVAVVTTNLPMTFPLFRGWLRPFFGSKLASTPKQYKTPNGFHTIGGGTGGQDSANLRSRSLRRPADPHALTNLSVTESEEHMMDDIKMQGVKVYVDPPSGNTNGIEVSHVVEVSSVDIISDNHTIQPPQRVHENW